jgi:hypothetical protein
MPLSPKLLYVASLISLQRSSLATSATTHLCVSRFSLIERTETMLYRLRASGMLIKPIFLKCKTTAVVTLPMIDLHPSAAPLDITTMVITLL